MSKLEQIESREEREQAYIDNAISPSKDARGIRYVKGGNVNIASTDWKGLDLLLRSDANAAAALPERFLVTSRVFAALALTTGLLMVAGIAASSNSGLSLSGKITGPGVLLVGGGAMSLAFGLGAGICLGKAKRGYRRAVDVYNDSLGLRLGIYSAAGNYISSQSNSD